ncbi:MAG: hypothetical protein M3304_02785 [Actinomycetota bacterium]|nr:hypothetical protein [Actinomycetota bacterium]
MRNHIRWLEVAIALAAFGALAGVVLLTDAPRGVLLPTWTGVTLALAAYAHRRGGTWLPKRLGG